MIPFALTQAEFLEARSKILAKSLSIRNEWKAIIECGGGVFEPCVDLEAAEKARSDLQASRAAAHQRYKRCVLATRAWVEANEDCNLANERLLASMRKPGGGYWTEGDWAIFDAKHGIKRA